MLKRSPKQRARSLADFLHRGFVISCVGATVLGTTYLGYRFYLYMTVSRPQFIQKRKLAEQELLAEGSAENLKDMAPTIS